MGKNLYFDAVHLPDPRALLPVVGLLDPHDGDTLVSEASARS